MSKNFKMTIFLIIIAIPISCFQLAKYKKQCDLMKNVAKDVYIPGGSEGEKIWTLYFGFDGDEKKLGKTESFTYQEFSDIKASTVPRLYNDKYRLIRLGSLLDEKFWYYYPVAFDEDFWAILLSDSKDVAGYCKRINSLLKKDAEVPPVRSFLRECILFHMTNYYNDFIIIDREKLHNIIYNRKHRELKFKTGEIQWKLTNFTSEDHKNISGIITNKRNDKWELLQKYDIDFNKGEKLQFPIDGSYNINLPIMQKRNLIKGGMEARFLIIHFNINKNGKVKIQETELTDYRDLQEKFTENPKRSNWKVHIPFSQ